MRLPLLVAMKPEDNFQGATVLVGKGSWIVTSTHMDSNVQLVNESEILPIKSGSTPLPPIIKDHELYFVHIEKAGSEKEISIYLEKQ